MVHTGSEDFAKQRALTETRACYSMKLAMADAEGLSAPTPGRHEWSGIDPHGSSSSRRPDASVPLSSFQWTANAHDRHQVAFLTVAEGLTMLLQDARHNEHK